MKSGFGKKKKSFTAHCLWASRTHPYMLQMRLNVQLLAWQQMCSVRHDDDDDGDDGSKLIVFFLLFYKSFNRVMPQRASPHPPRFHFLSSASSVSPLRHHQGLSTPRRAHSRAPPHPVPFSALLGAETPDELRGGGRAHTPQVPLTPISQEVDSRRSCKLITEHSAPLQTRSVRLLCEIRKVGLSAIML